MSDGPEAPRYAGLADRSAGSGAITAGPFELRHPLEVRHSVQVRFFASYELTWVPCSPYGSIDHWFRVDALGNV